ncbi:MAG TPA: hypothetical protein QF528_04960 [Phycisphaerales bacterium]|jgi:hypothetical protein|nr:hypothetical protein [Phycisphaerales bacterium]|tara:strand:+ start:291 stop:692 length:402 start_codon:yes stop_codon:yes gene_type:complete
MSSARKCTVFTFTLTDKPGQLLSLSNRLRTADITLRSFWATSNDDGTSTLRCIAERDPQFRDFSHSAELQVTEEQAILIISHENAGGFLRILEKLASAEINIGDIHAVTLKDQQGWVVWTDEEQLDLLIDLID